MQQVENQTFGPGSIVLMDDKYFIRCRFDGCMIVFSGGEFGWIECSFGQIQLSFAGAAERVIAYARIFGLVAKGGEQPPPTGIPGTSKGEH